MKQPGQNLFITGIDTGVGKTLVSSIVLEASGWDYWKPIQCGDLNNSDTKIVKELTTRTECFFHPERFSLKTAASPHRAAALEKVKIRSKDLKLPSTRKTLVVEGAGGILVPLNEEEMLVDMASEHKLLSLIVSKNYLGSLNHTFLSIECLQNRGVPILGLIFNGKKDKDLEDFVSKRSRLPILLNIDEHPFLTKELVTSYAKKLKGPLNERLAQFR